MITLIAALALISNPSFASTPAASITPVKASLVAPAPVPEAAPMLASVAVTLECTAHADGHVDACRVLEETHPGLGFGAAAIALMDGSEVARGDRDVQFARTIQFMP